MLFNSIEFAVFLPIVFFLYWFVLGGRRVAQNVLLLLASYLFYGWWDWRFLSLIAFSSLVDYRVGIGLGEAQDPKRRKMLLLTSIGVNLGFLGIFKYFNFFADSFYQAFSLLGRPVDDPFMLKVVLPVGISFYTFQTLSYSIDVYRKKLAPTRSVVDFFAFVSFFPQLVAGPIERATHLLPQFRKPRTFSYAKASDGLRQILWGLFKKIVIADNCAVYANQIFEGHADYSGSTLLLGAIFFAFQIYGDFSGYSDIAIGTSRLFGFSLMRNFAFPYFSRDVAEFWRRWHISLSTWFRDYLYIPLGGSQGHIFKKVRNIFIIFVVSGFWHGANWTFIVWGALNAIYFIPLLLAKQNRRHVDAVAANKFLPNFKELVQIGCTFALTLVAWIFFRAENMGYAIAYLRGMASASLLARPEFFPTQLLALLVLFVAAEWLQRDQHHALHLSLERHPLPVRWGLYYGTTLLILLFAGQQQEFIYFQF